MMRCFFFSSTFKEWPSLFPLSVVSGLWPRQRWRRCMMRSRHAFGEWNCSRCVCPLGPVGVCVPLALLDCSVLETSQEPPESLSLLNSYLLKRWKHQLSDHSNSGLDAFGFVSAFTFYRDRSLLEDLEEREHLLQEMTFSLACLKANGFFASSKRPSACRCQEISWATAGGSQITSGWLLVVKVFIWFSFGLKLALKLSSNDLWLKKELLSFAY